MTMITSFVKSAKCPVKDDQNLFYSRYKIFFLRYVIKEIYLMYNKLRCPWSHWKYKTNKINRIFTLLEYAPLSFWEFSVRGEECFIQQPAL